MGERCSLPSVLASREIYFPTESRLVQMLGLCSTFHRRRSGYRRRSGRFAVRFYFGWLSALLVGSPFSRSRTTSPSPRFSLYRRRDPPTRRPGPKLRDRAMGIGRRGKDSNLRPLPCNSSALPLSYAPSTAISDARLQSSKTFQRRPQRQVPWDCVSTNP